jgi:acylphosphatase
MSDAVAVHLFVHGRVQGVFYRAKTQKTAKRLGGWVRNCDDGSVEIHAEGNREQLEELITWCRRGPTLASVSNIDLNWLEAEGLGAFDIR